MEGYYIAKQLTIIVGSLEGNCNETLITRLEQENGVTDPTIRESELSRVLNLLLEDAGYASIGSRTEKKLLGLGREMYSHFRRNPDERRLNEMLLREEDAIRHGLILDIKSR